MAEGEDWLYRPALAHLCSYESLIEGGRLDYMDVVVMNEMLDVQQENNWRAEQANRNK